LSLPLKDGEPLILFLDLRAVFLGHDDQGFDLSVVGFYVTVDGDDRACERVTIPASFSSCSSIVIGFDLYPNTNL
jgi:hypothetical protein